MVEYLTYHQWVEERDRLLEVANNYYVHFHDIDDPILPSYLSEVKKFVNEELGVSLKINVLRKTSSVKGVPHEHLQDFDIRDEDYQVPTEEQLRALPLERFHFRGDDAAFGQRLDVDVAQAQGPARGQERGDVARLTGIPGVGKKTAERIVLELKGSLDDFVPAAGSGPRLALRKGEALDEAVLALISLGYRRNEAERVLADVARARPDGPTEELVRAALRELGRPVNR